MENSQKKVGNNEKHWKHFKKTLFYDVFRMLTLENTMKTCWETNQKTAGHKQIRKQLEQIENIRNNSKNNVVFMMCS